MRLVTRSDFDGLVCGALLLEAGIIDSWKFAHPKDLQDGLVEVSENDCLANVPFVPGCGLWFDHHSSEHERLALEGKFKGESRITPSCARIIYEYYGGAERFPQYGEVMEAVDKVDSGNLTLEEILNPAGWILIGFLMDPRTGLGRWRQFTISNYQLMEKLLAACHTMRAEEILAMPDIQERVEVYQEQTEKFKDIDPEKADELMMDPEWLSSDMGAKGFDSLRNFTEAQKSGADVFMASLGKMRMFPFFNRMSNWLLPFHTANRALAPVVDGEGAATADTVSRMPVICDSDKYALLLSMAATPEALRAKAFEAMTAQIFNASQTPEFQEVFSSGANRRALVTSYVHTLYRFFTQFHNGKEFPKPMATEPVIDLFAPFINFEDSKENLATVADILFSSKHYRAALEWYQELEESEKLDNARRRKMVFAAEMSAKYLAVEMYQALLEIDPGDLWAAMRLASCMLREGNDNGAYTVLEPFLPNNSDNIEFLRLMATTYMHAGKYEAALDTLHNLDYLLGEGDYSAKGDIAWATALCGNIPEAIEVYELADGTPLTQARRALVLWLGGQRPKSLEIMASLAGRGVDFDKIGLYDNGYQHLFVKAQGGLSLSQIPDALRYKIYGSKFGNLL